MSIIPYMLLGWIIGILSAIGFRWLLCWYERREARKNIEAVNRIALHRAPWGELERRRMLKAFTDKHANAEIVELGRAEPQVRTIGRWQKAP